METAQLPLPHPSECGSDEWARQMRLRFSPVGMCSETGDIVQDFFRPSGLALCGEEGSRWGAAQQAALYMGLEKYGVGKWRDMATEHPALEAFDDAAIRTKAARLLGTQSLARHAGWKGNQAAVDAERARHRAIGIQLGCWKGGVLVEDAQGSVAAAMASSTLPGEPGC
ncbi:hypothetical protein ACKKBG_A39190 [Auxenochlorella protothecoides x Auxenochlorella symbiontica]